MDTCNVLSMALNTTPVEMWPISPPMVGMPPLPKDFQVMSYPAREAHDFIWVWWGEPQSDYPPLPWFEDLDSGFTYGRDYDLWPVHYSRAIENQLDVFHLPFVHHNTIGRGRRYITDGPVTELKDNTLKVWVMNRVEGRFTSQIPARPKRADIPCITPF